MRMFPVPSEGTLEYDVQREWGVWLPDKQMDTDAEEERLMWSKILNDFFADVTCEMSPSRAQMVLLLPCRTKFRTCRVLYYTI